MAAALAQSKLSLFLESFQIIGNAAEKIPAGYTPTWYEVKWLSLFEGRNEALVFGLVAFFHHLVFYYGRYLPYYIADYIPALQKYRLQPNKVSSDKMWWHCFTSLLKSQLLVQLPMMMMFYPAARVIGFTMSVPFPSLVTVAYQCVIFLFVEDFYHYWVHRLMHQKDLYKRIHKVHHEYTAPFGITAEYAHPLETVILGQGTIGGPILYSYIATSMGATEGVHVVTMLVWISVRLFQTIEAHCGYDFPWALSNWFPLWAGADHHDYHHMEFVNNFASTFRYLDRIFGTDKSYQRYYKKRTQNEQNSDKKHD
ncbi:Methylsterol monooxygenase [Zancudomyces culisetae]|uniref:Methylsterol monooxygenase n=1 Tax=Zancudomyces culisetae TaxID=1213189 RepID=A0A1R1PFY2_ZANCU|nr:Methylsterol monooxygenase [Zancudomyces culisetae]|eukprot:OMH79867.1 Methylsterol monooxygenase [Zancudomyces culisetae]